MASDPAQDPRKLIYPETYFVGMSPPEIRLALLSRGARFDWQRPLRYLELGFGSGFSLNLHAAANDGEFWGADFVRAHVDGAAAIAAISGADVRLFADSFVELLQRDDLPSFDVVAAHGIWTWVPDADRAAIVALLKRRLAPGGVFYVSYNNTAGWSSVVYLRQLMKLFLAENGGRASISDAVAFARTMQGAGAAYFRENPTAAAELAAMSARDPVYLQQEYFLDDWQLMSLAEVETALMPAGLSFGAQFPLIAHDDELVLGATGRQMVGALQSPMLREAVRECFQGMGFRQDLFVRDAVPLSAEERRRRFRDMLFMLTARPNNIVVNGGSPWGELDLAARGCIPIVYALAEADYGPRSVGELEAALPSIPIDDLIVRLVLLAAVRVIRPALQLDERRIVSARCEALNAHILSMPSETGAVVASPTLGAGVELSALEKTYLAAYRRGEREVTACARVLERECAAHLRGRNPGDVALVLKGDLPIYRAMKLIGD